MQITSSLSVSRLRPLVASVLLACTLGSAQAATRFMVPYVDFAYTNQRGVACYATLQTNAGVHVLEGFLKLWEPRSRLVDAGVSAPATEGCAAVTTTDWDGIPGSATDGKVKTKQQALFDANLNYVIQATQNRTAEQAVLAYLDDRRGKNYSLSNGMGPLTSTWRSLTQQTTSITGVPADATTVKYDDTGNNRGVGSSSGNTTFGFAVDFENTLSNNGSTEPAKRFYKIGRPWRWSSSVVVLPTLVPAKSSTPVTDGSFPSGHSAEAMRDALAMAYLVPERFQELLTRASELGESRILAGMHTPLDVMGGRIQATAVVTGNLYALGASSRANTHAQSHAALMTATASTSDAAFYTLAHSASLATDPFADHATNRANYLRRMTYGLPVVGDTTAAAKVPTGAEILLETRLPYLNASQRREVLRTTAMASGYPIMDDFEGWGRLNLFDAADGYGAFTHDVKVTMDASLGSFHAADTWRNAISGSGKLIKAGSGSLTLSGANTFSGGVRLTAGTLVAASSQALGTGPVKLFGGTLAVQADAPVQLPSDFVSQADSTLNLTLNRNGGGQLQVAGSTQLHRGALNINFANGTNPQAGDTFTLLQTGALQGKFGTVTVAGFSKVKLSYSATSTTLTLLK